MYMLVAFFDELAFAAQYPGYRIQRHTVGIVLVTYCSAGDGGGSGHSSDLMLSMLCAGGGSGSSSDLMLSMLCADTTGAFLESI